MTFEAMKTETDHILRAGPTNAQSTVTAFLREQLPGRSWSDVRRLIRSRRVMIDGNLCLDGGRRLRGTEVIKLLAHPTAAPPREDDVRICYLDAHLVVVDKPPRMTSVRHAEEQNWSARRRQIQPTLEDVLPRAIAKKCSRGQQGRRGAPPGKLPPVKPVHRLDRDTSGLIVFARTKAAEQRLVQQFRRHTTERRYLAIAHGHVAAQTIESNLVRDRGDGRRGSTMVPELGKRAITHIAPLEHFDGYSLVECRLETGRTHQIRIHLAESGHPVCGETVYQKPLHGLAAADASGAPRLALHAIELRFDHPITGESLRFHAPLPNDLRTFLDRLHKSES
jgi:23S rRNA pseudouridine1911/1915/1917 synthase